MAASSFSSSTSTSTSTPFRSIECCAGRATAATSVVSFPTRAYLGCRLLSLERAQHARSVGRFISVLSVSTGRSVRRNAILALDPDFYKIPYVEGVPVGNRLKLWNLPPNCDHGELHEWLNSIPDVNAVTLEFTDDADLNAQGVGGFVEFGTKQEACMAIVRLDGRKFKGRCIRMDFVEKRPHEREIGGRRNRPSRNYSRGGSYSGGSSSMVQNFEPRGTYSGGIGSPTVATGDGSIGTTGSPISSPVATSYSAPPPPRSYGPPPTSHRVFVGNLSWSIDDNGLQSLFSNHGTVLEARVMRDRETGNSRGFGFVAMSTAEEMNSAISALDGKQVEGRTLKVNVASR